MKEGEVQVGPQTLRLAVVGTPRSGNTWVRSLLADLYDLQEIPVQVAQETPWTNLPARCVIQVHWAPWPWFLRNVGRHGVQVVTPARHPFDVLMSWLNHVYYVHLEGVCPGGGACKECAIVGALPGSDTFLDYVRSEAGQFLLSFSPAWWNRPGVLRLRYEDLVEAPEDELGRLVGRIGEAPRKPLAEALEATSIARLKPSHEVRQYQYWQGQSGLWRAMLPAARAREIAAAVPTAFEVLGYDCDPDESLDPAGADRNWLQLQLSSTREHLALERRKRLDRVRELEVAREQVRRLERRLAEAGQSAPAGAWSPA
jgi:hypothetical protein